MNPYTGLREQVIKLDKPPLLTGPDGRPFATWGVLMELGLADGTITVVSIGDGTTSLYTSSGGGVLAAGQRPGPATASRNLVISVERQLDDFAPVVDVPLPKPGIVAFVALTHEGPRLVESTPREMNATEHPLHGLWISANAVLNEVRLVNEAPPGPGQPGTPPA